ncbi:MAG: hypothetical protein IJR52_11385 [Selenomonadaceae bacterium]|nr:hypothetical protein [Selenomonadaceae bacterium]
MANYTSASHPFRKNFAVVLKGVSLNFVEENSREDLELAKIFLSAFKMTRKF